MVQPFIGEIRMFGGTFAPVGWAFCDGSIINVAENEALFAQLGSTFGGNGRTTFGLPDMRGRVPVHVGGTTGTSVRTMGQQFGSENTTLTSANFGSHTHNFMASTTAADSHDPTGHVVAKGTNNQFAASNNPRDMDSGSILANSGSNQTVNNLQAFVAINFIIALVGLIPSQT